MRFSYAKLFMSTMVLALGFTQLAWASDSPITHEHQKVSYGGSSYTLDIIRVDLLDPTIQVKAVAANHELGSVQPFSDMMTDNHAVVRVNGTFFDAFTDEINYRTPYGIVMNNNDLFYSGDKDISITVSSDKEAFIQRLKVNSYVNAGSLGSFLAGVDVYYGDVPHSAWVFTKDYGDQVDYPGVKIVAGSDNKVKGVTSDASLVIPDGGKVLLLSSDLTLDRVAKSVKIGDKFSISQTATNLNTKASTPLDQMRMAIGAGPKLVTDGSVDVDYERDRFDDPLITSKANVRSFAGVDQDNLLVVRTISFCTIEQMANVMVEIGMKDAINLDGGASSALFYKGIMLRKPGRLLSNALVVQQSDKPQVQLQVNGQIANNAFGYVDHDVTMVPFRALLNRMNSQYNWDGDTSSLTITNDKNTIVVKLGSAAATVNGLSVTMDAEPQVVDGHLYVPLRFVAEAIGAQVEWNDSLYRANVTLPNLTKPKESK